MRNANYLFHWQHSRKGERRQSVSPTGKRQPQRERSMHTMTGRHRYEEIVVNGRIGSRSSIQNYSRSPTYYRSRRQSFPTSPPYYNRPSRSTSPNDYQQRSAKNLLFNYEGNYGDIDYHGGSEEGKYLLGINNFWTVL